MGRGKVQMKLIENQRQRKKTYRTRKEGLKKKIYELSTLCDIDAALVCFDPTGGGGSGQVDMWPNDEQRVQNIFTRYYSSSSGGGLTAATSHGCDEQQQQPVDQEALLESRLNSVRERIHCLLTNMRKENKCKEMVTMSADHYSHEDHHHHQTTSTSFKKEIMQDWGSGSGCAWSCYNNSISIPDHADAGLGGLLDYDQYYPYHHQLQQQQLTVFDPVPLPASFDWAMDGTIFGVTTTDHATAAAAVTDFSQLLPPPPPVLLDAEPLAVAPPLMSDNNNNYHVVMHGGHDVADAATGHGSSMGGINIGFAQSSPDQLPAADWY